jgi:DNA modification methylase
MTYLLIRGNARRLPIADNSVHCCVTSPPYFGLRDYGVDGQIGLEPTPEAFVAVMVAVFREVHRVLRADGTLWLNLGDSYNNAGSRNNGTGLDGKRRGGVGDTDGTWSDAKETYRDNRHALREEGIKCKDLIGIPWRVALALQADGWYLRSDIIWAKPNPMPESVTDRPTKSHEYLFLMTKSDRYFYDAEAIREAGSENPITAARRHRTDNGAVGTSALFGNGIGQSGKGSNTDARGETGRNRRTVWTVATQPFPGAHFATFPPKLIEPCIRAGTSEKGCCPECGGQWGRVTEREASQFNPSAGRERVNATGGAITGGTRACTLGVTEFVQRSTLGWQPSCRCPEHTPIPCVVLDPFGGAMTTAVVATGLGRRAICTELSAEYLALGQRRLERPHATLTTHASDEPLPLFASNP